MVNVGGIWHGGDPFEAPSDRAKKELKKLKGRRDEVKWEIINLTTQLKTIEEEIKQKEEFVSKQEAACSKEVKNEPKTT